MNPDSEPTLEEKSHTMPLWARMIVTVLGAVLLPAGIGAFLLLRPLGWPMISLATGGILAGLDCVAAAISGKWPVSLHFIL